MKTKRHLLLVVLMLALLTIPTLVVFAKELGTLTITGPGIKGELTLDDPKITSELEHAGFFDQSSAGMNAPKNLDLKSGYHITASLNLDGRLTPYIQMVYYAAEEGQPAYLHYISRLEGDSMQKLDEWTVVNRSADIAFRSILADNNVTVQSALVAAPVKEAPAASAAEPAKPVTVPVTASKPEPVQAPYLIWAVGAAIVVLIGAGLLIRRRTMTTMS